MYLPSACCIASLFIYFRFFCSLPCFPPSWRNLSIYDFSCREHTRSKPYTVYQVPGMKYALSRTGRRRIVSSTTAILYVCVGRIACVCAIFPFFSCFYSFFSYQVCERHFLPQEAIFHSIYILRAYICHWSLSCHHGLQHCFFCGGNSNSSITGDHT